MDTTDAQQLTMEVKPRMGGVNGHHDVVGGTNGSTLSARNGMECGDNNMQLNFCGSEEIYMQSILGDFSNEIFSSEDLYAVMDSSSTVAVSEINNAYPWQAQAQGFIPVQPETKQIQGTELRTDANGNFHLLVLKDEAASVSSEGSRASENENVSTSSPVNESPAAGASPASSQQESVAPVKIRKPRGRKPKAVKEAEAAAAAAAAQKNVYNAPPDTQENADSGPTIVVHHKPMHFVNANVNVSSGTFNQNKGPAIIPHFQHSHNGNNFPQNKFMQGQMSLEQLAMIDRSNFFARKNGIGGDGIGQQSDYTDRNLQHSIPPGGLRAQDNCLGRCSSGERAHADINLIHHSGNGVLGGGRPVNTFVPDTNRICNSVQQTQFNEQNGSNSRLEQMVCSRLSNIVPPKRSTVTPSYIQQNIGLYKQLTAPKKQSDYENQKFSEEKWRQRPSPSVPSVDSPINAAGGANMEKLCRNVQVSNMQKLQNLGSPDVFSVAGSNRNSYNYDPRDPRLVNDGNGLNIHNMNTGRSNNGTNGSIHGNRNCDFNMQSYSQDVLRNLPVPRNSSTNNPIDSTSGELAAEYKMRFQQSFSDINEMKLRVHYASKMNKHLNMRLQLALEEIETLKAYIKRNINFRQSTSDANFLVEREFGFNNLMRGAGGQGAVWNNGLDNRVRNNSAWSLQKIREEQQTPPIKAAEQCELNEFMQFTRALQQLNDGAAKTFKRSLPMDLDMAAKKCATEPNSQEPDSDSKIGVNPEFKSGEIDSGSKLSDEPKDDTLLCHGTSQPVNGSHGTVSDSNFACLKETQSSPEKSEFENNGSAESPKSGTTTETELVTADESDTTTSTMFNSPLGVGTCVNSYGGTGGTDLSFNFNNFK